MHETGPQPDGENARGLRSLLRRWSELPARCIGWRLVITLGASLLLVLASSGWLALQLHRKHLYSMLAENATGIGETILASTNASMMENNRQHLLKILENIGQREGVLAVRLFNARGEVSYSSLDEEIGTTTNLQAPLCRGCHNGGEPRVPRSIRDGLQLYSLPPGEGALGLAVPVLNTPECSNADCHIHPPEQRVLGMMDLELTTAPLEAALVDTKRQLLILGLGTVLLISAALGLFTWRLVHRPIISILKGTRRLGGGDLSYRMDETGPGELGELAASFNEMSGRLQGAQNELAEWNQRLEAKVAEKTRELERARDQMVFAEKMASLGKLAAIVAHEINNPLAGVLVYTKLVRRQLPKLLERSREPADGEKGRKLEETLATMESEVARCGDIVRNLLLFSRRREPHHDPVDLNGVIDRSVRLIRHQADLNSVAIELALEPGLPEVICDASQIEQATLAALMNGLEAMPDGGILTVRTGLDPEHGQVRIEIEDTGIGIPDAIRDKIFEPFFSTKSEGKGTGLGLSVMYGIVQAHGGRIDFDSTPGSGTCFRMRLPLVAEPVGVGGRSDPGGGKGETP
jgi:two-component system NtrC family sensor kinase